MRTRWSRLFATALVLAEAGVACGSGGSGGAPPERTSTLRLGQPAPAFALPSAQGRRVSLAEFRDRRPVLLYFSMGPG